MRDAGNSETCRFVHLVHLHLVHLFRRVTYNSMELANDHANMHALKTGVLVPTRTEILLLKTRQCCVVQ